MKKKIPKKLTPKKSTPAPALVVPHVFQAINAVQGALASEGIGKGRENKAQNYAFRGIDDIYNSLAKHLAAHQLVIVPRCVNRTCKEQPTAKGGILFYVVVEVEYDLISTKDSSKHLARIFGEAMDSSDKATNKALSAAYKYLCLQLFCIPTEGDNDSENRSLRVKAKVAAQLEKDKEADAIGTPVSWRDYVIHFGKNQGARLGDIEKKNMDALLWYVHKWPGHLPGKRPSQADTGLRKALDRAKEDLAKPPAEAQDEIPMDGVDQTGGGPTEAERPQA